MLCFDVVLNSYDYLLIFLYIDGDNNIGMSCKETFKFIKQSDLRSIRQSENLQYLTGEHAWSVYQASPLFKLSFTKSSFNKYEALFSKKLPGCSVTFSCLKGLPYSIPSLLIEVTKNGKDLFSSIFLSVATTEESDDCLALPMHLVRKPVKKDIAFKVHRIIENTFRCRIRPLKLSEYQTYWLMVIGLKESLRISNTPMTITLKLPIHISANINLYIDGTSLSKIWNSIHNSENDVLHFKTVNMFFREIQCHMKATYGIDPSTSPIISFALKDMCSQFHEQVCLSVNKPEIVYMLLCYLATDCISD